MTEIRPTVSLAKGYTLDLIYFYVRNPQIYQIYSRCQRANANHIIIENPIKFRIKSLLTKIYFQSVYGDHRY